MMENWTLKDVRNFNLQYLVLFVFFGIILGLTGKYGSPFGLGPGMWAFVFAVSSLAVITVVLSSLAISVAISNIPSSSGARSGQQQPQQSQPQYHPPVYQPPPRMTISSQPQPQPQPQPPQQPQAIIANNSNQAEAR